MSVSFEKRNKSLSLTFTISQEQIKPELDRVFNSVKKTIVPGPWVIFHVLVFKLKNLVKKRFTKML